MKDKMRNFPILCITCGKEVDRSKPYFVILLHKEVEVEEDGKSEIEVLDNEELSLFCSEKCFEENHR